MSGCGSALHTKNVRVLRAQAQSGSDMLNRDLRLAEPHLDPAAEDPRPCKVRIEHESMVGEGGSIVEIAHDADYNFVRMHKTLRMTPAMAANVSDRLWSIEELVERTSR